MTGGPPQITERERPIRTRQPANPQREVWHLMHRQARDGRAAREEAARRHAADHDRQRKLVIDLARAHHQLRVFLDRQSTTLADTGLGEQVGMLITIRDRYEQVLTRAGAELIYRDGQPLTGGPDDQMKVTAWIPAAELSQPRVRETVRPGVLLHGELVCPVEVEVEGPVQPAAIDPLEVTDEPRDRD